MQILFTVETCTLNLWAKSSSNNPSLNLTRTIKNSSRVLIFRRLPGLFPWDPSTSINAANSNLLLRCQHKQYSHLDLKNCSKLEGFYNLEIPWKNCNPTGTDWHEILENWRSQPLATVLLPRSLALEGSSPYLQSVKKSRSRRKKNPNHGGKFNITPVRKRLQEESQDTLTSVRQGLVLARTGEL